MPFRRYHPALIGLLAWSRICVATTVVAIVSPQGIVVASDTGATTRTESFTPISRESTIKILPVKNRLIVAEIGTSDFSGVGNGSRRDYHFSEWVSTLQASLPAEVTLEALAERIAAEAPAAFEPINEELRSGRMKQANLQEKFKMLAEYVIIGYAGREPKIYIVQLYIDWDGNKILEPKSFLLHPGSGVSHRGYASYSFGITQALDDIGNKSSSAYRQVLKQCPDFAVLSNGHDIGLDSITNIARAEIRVEERTNPSRVFGDIATILLPPGGVVSILKTVRPSDKVLCEPVRNRSKGHRRFEEHSQQQPD